MSKYPHEGQVRLQLQDPRAGDALGEVEEGRPCAHGVHARTQLAWVPSPHNNKPPRIRVFTLPKAVRVGCDDVIDGNFVVCGECLLVELQQLLATPLTAWACLLLVSWAVAAGAARMR